MSPIGRISLTPSPDRQIEGGRIGQMSKQMRLSKRQFEDFVDCRLMGEVYAQMLLDAGDVTEF
jgi:hypothetical protein